MAPTANSRASGVGLNLRRTARFGLKSASGYRIGERPKWERVGCRLRRRGLRSANLTRILVVCRIVVILGLFTACCLGIP